MYTSVRFFIKSPSSFCDLLTAIKRSKHTINNRLKNLLINMPNKKQIEEVQKKRNLVKEKSAKYAPGTVTIQVLGCGSPSTTASVYLFTDQSRYLFNCGEGTQRLAHEHKIKLSRLEHIFITRTSWERFGGLPGLSLTVQDAGVPNLTLHGPSGLIEIFQGMRRFVVLKHLRVDSVDCEDGGSYEDQVMEVFYVPLKKSTTEKPGADSNHIELDSESPSEVDETDYYANERDGTNDCPPSLKIDGEKRDENVVLSYICKLKPRPGTLNLEKCVEFGVPPGPLLGQLKNGFDITLENGRVVRADQVRGPTDLGPVFIFIDIPSIEYLEALKNSTAFDKYQAGRKEDDIETVVVIHFSPPEIMQNEIYCEFMEKFTPSTKHLVLNSTNKFSGYLAAHRIQYQLNQINKYVFPILQENFNTPSPTNTNKKIRLSSIGEKLNENHEDALNRNRIVHPDETSSLTCYHLRPLKGLDRSIEPILDPREYLDECNRIEGFTESLLQLKTKFLDIYSDKYKREEEFPKIIFLGTGSCIPNKTRNVSAILMQAAKDSYMLLDCGEGTWGQMIRFFGLKKAINVLKKLKLVYISHLHADHHTGLIGILRARQTLFGSEVAPITLLAPKQIQSWLCFYDYRIESIRQNYSLIPNGDMIRNPFSSPNLQNCGIEAISTCLVRHCPHAFGVSLQLQKEFNGEKIKMVYSGDTMPCNDLIELGRDCTVLIHEATMEDDLIDEAKFKMHSTVSQAIELGEIMNARYTILTHFSQRYAKIPRIENVLDKNVTIAFDNMEVTLTDLDYLHMIYPTLKIMFTEHCEEMEQKSIKRALRKEKRRMLLNESSPIR